MEEGNWEERQESYLMTRAINLSINEALTAAQDGHWTQTGHVWHRAVLLWSQPAPAGDLSLVKHNGLQKQPRDIAQGQWEEVASTRREMLRNSNHTE